MTDFQSRLVSERRKQTPIHQSSTGRHEELTDEGNCDQDRKADHQFADFMLKTIQHGQSSFREPRATSSTLDRYFARNAGGPLWVEAV
jgi:hypothetical protein